MTEIPKAAIDAMIQVVAAYEPEATAAAIRKPGSLLSVLLEASRRALEAAAPHIAAAEDVRILDGLRGDTFLATDGLGQQAAAVPWSKILGLVADPVSVPGRSDTGGGEPR
jgi:hypothetical protein